MESQTKVFSKPLQVSRAWQLRPAERQTILVLGDLFMAMLALGIALYIWSLGDRWLGFSPQFFQERVPWWFYFLPLAWIVLLLELYDLHRAGDWKATVRGVATAASVGLVLYLFLFFLYSGGSKALLPRRGFASFLVAVSVLTLFWRYLYLRIVAQRAFMRRVLLVGAGKSGQVLLDMLDKMWPPPFEMVGIIDDDWEKIGPKVGKHVVFGGSERIQEVIVEHQITDIVVAISGEMRGQMFQALLDAQEKGVELTRMSTLYEELMQRVPIQLLDAYWLLRSFCDEARVSAFYRLGKRLLDIVGGLIGCLGLAVIFPFIALAIWIDSGRPIFYSQVRLGRGGKPFRMIKFRTMRQDAEADGKAVWAVEADERATRVGRFLRKTHLDETPQFISVLRGEMSLVGPRAERPEMIEALQQNVPFYRARLLVKPGITGWAQVNYGYGSSINAAMVKLEHDLYYIKHRNLWLDILILLRTPWWVLGLRGQ